MVEPAHWWRPGSWLSLVLAPLGWVYGLFAAARLRKPGVDVGIPVICVGNYHIGGAGKTPTAIALVEILTGAGERPFVLSRGYGGANAGPLLVDASRHTASDVGDEPLLLAAVAPVVVSRDRAAGARLASQRGATVVVMDDGFQNPSLNKHLALIVIDGTRGIGNGAVFPAGPLRAPLPIQVDRTAVLVIVGDGSAADRIAEAVASRGGLVLRARFEADKASVNALRGRPVLAFAGIGDPERFFGTLRTNGIVVAATRSFPDHHRYRDNELAALATDAQRDGLTLVTTTKDLVRLRAAGGNRTIDTVADFRVRLVVDDEAALRERLLRALKAARQPARAAQSEVDLLTS